MTGTGSFADTLAGFVGRGAGAEVEAPDPVNQAMIRHWVEAMGDENPVYVDDGAARRAGFAGVVAPATMLQAWTMRGYRRSMELERGRHLGAGPGGRADALEELFALLDGRGFTSVVATDCEQEYRRPLVLGDRLRATSVIEAVSPEKRTALGPGHFVTTRTDYLDEAGEVVAVMRFRILRFRPARQVPEAPSGRDPHQGEPAPAAGAAHERRPLRPRPSVTADSAFFFEGAKAGKLLAQRCRHCGRLRHPPAPSCPWCRSLEWEAQELSGRGTLYSYVVVHHPRVAAFDYPLVVGLAQMEEGTRLVADVVGVDPGHVRIGMPIDTELVPVDPELTLPVFKARSAPPGGPTR
jgi:uncharacterized OB-fold protein/acyl dehydratase